MLSKDKYSVLFFAQLMISTKILLTLKTEIEGRQLQSNFTAHVQMNCNTSKFNECVGIFCGQHSSIWMGGVTLNCVGKGVLLDLLTWIFIWLITS